MTTRVGPKVAAVYAERFISGMSAAAVTPVALAAVGDIAAPEQTRARRLTLVSLAGVIGFLLVPMVGVFIAQGAAGNAQGSQLGKQTATASLGAAIGSAAGGLLFDVTWLPDASFVLIAALTISVTMINQ